MSYGLNVEMHKQVRDKVHKVKQCLRKSKLLIFFMDEVLEWIENSF